METLAANTCKLVFVMLILLLSFIIYINFYFFFFFLYFDFGCTGTSYNCVFSRMHIFDLWCIESGSNPEKNQGVINIHTYLAQTPEIGQGLGRCLSS